MGMLSEDETAVLREALDDEYRAWATYDRVVADFGMVRPFVNIREAEARHIAALRALFESHGLPFPPNPWAGRVQRYASVQDACAAAVVAEVENGRMYDRLLDRVAHPDVRAVLLRLKEASEDRHLPAFRRCLARAGGGGRR